MPLAAVLTVGWPEIVGGEQASAPLIHETCQTHAGPKGEGYTTQLLPILQALRQKAGDEQPILIQGTEQLFRRRTRGFGGVQQFVGHLNDVVASNPELKDVQCEIDVFAYAFLKGAKNFDFFLPEVTSTQGPFRTVYPQWRQHMEELKRFERDGRPPQNTDTNLYLALRRLLFRHSARDERRTLATLLVSGPSTRQEITEDLGLPYSLAQRLLPTFQAIGVLDRHDEATYVIRGNALPCVVFSLREVMGLDLLLVLDKEG